MYARIRLAGRLLRDVGLDALRHYALYQLGLRSGFYRWRTPTRGVEWRHPPELNLDLFSLPSAAELTRILGGETVSLLAEADEIVAGEVRLFGGRAQPFSLACPNPQCHWTELEGKAHPDDIKVIWEPARLGWVFTLGRAYRLSGNQRYPETFWNHWEQFVRLNPLNYGENWMSAQEVALRLIGLIFAAQVFRDSPLSTPQRITRLTAAMIDHACRVAATPAYARAQNNNHLLSEAAGLILAAHVLPEWTQAPSWRRSGWRRFNRAVIKQIGADGEYIQHSVNYHRLALHLALLVQRAARLEDYPFPVEVLRRLGLAAHWLAGVMDETSGAAIQLGHHDGANLLPLGGGEIADYRATLQAALATFTGQRALSPGKWDELAAWLGTALPESNPPTQPIRLEGVRRLGSPRAWACLRAARFASRPAHADQLHVHIWQDGNPVVLDAGTYSYNLPPPWQNGLAGAEMHNAPLVDNQQPMMRAGRFLWLDWDQAEFLPLQSAQDQRLCATRSGYRRLGIAQRRWLERRAERVWVVRDELLPARPSGGMYPVRLHWLLKDGIWRLAAHGCTVEYGTFTLAVSVEVSGGERTSLRLVRAAQVLAGGTGDFACLGWYSPTYLARLPALSLVVDFSLYLPTEIVTTFDLSSKNP